MKLGIIGCGNLGSSFIEGLVKSETIEPNDIIVADPVEEKLEEIEKLGIKTTTDNNKVAKESDTLFIAIKPGKVGEVLEEMNLSNDKLVVSLAAGIPTDYLQKHTNARIIRVMPNLAGKVTEMTSAYTIAPNATEEDEKFIEKTLNELGKTVKIEETQMNAVTGLSGSGPAYIFMVIQALRDAGEELGMSQKDAFKLAAQTVKGAAELAMESDKTLEEFIDMVCSPKGTTIEGVKILEDKKVQEAFKKAVEAATKRAEELSKE